jgi:GNAT superfamily N-acetyltransferase
VVVTRQDGGVVATLQLTFLRTLSRRGGLRMQVEAVRVAASERGAGLGQALLGWAVDVGRARGAVVAQLTTDRRRVDAHRFYQRLGWVDSHQGMKLDLT